MSTPELDQIEAEVRETISQRNRREAGEQLADTAAKVYDDKELQEAVAVAVAVAGNGLCAWRRVTPLEQGEVASLSVALLNLANAYGWLDKADPKIMAWVTLAGVGLAVAGNRRRLPDPEPAQPANADAAQPA